MSSYKVGSLFAGIGGIDLAFEQAGFEIAWANEIDAAACKTQLFGVYPRIYSHLCACIDFLVLPVLGFAAVCRIFRLAPTCQRIAVKDKSKPLGVVYGQSVVV